MVRKVLLKDLIDALRAAYDEGADYVDISGVSDDFQDTIAIDVRDEYIRDRDEGLSDEILNKLI